MTGLRAELLLALVERLRAVLAAPSREDVERSARGIVGPLALLAPMNQRVMQTTSAAIAATIQEYDGRARALHPELLAVVETARAYTIAHALCDTDGDEWHRLCATLAALDAAIAAALPAGDPAGDPSTATSSPTTHPGQKPHENR